MDYKPLNIIFKDIELQTLQISNLIIQVNPLLHNKSTYSKFLIKLINLYSMIIITM